LVGLGSRSVLAERPVAEAPKRKQLAPNVFFENEGGKRRVVIVAEVCLREGQLEGLLCRTHTKEHEYILAADVDARAVHTALMVAGAEPGRPVQFIPKYVPATGSAIKATLRYQKNGKTVVEPAGEWIQEVKTKEPLKQNWVFGGSRLIVDPEDKNK